MQEQKAMTDLYLLLAAVLCLFGAFSVILAKSPFDKLICLGILFSGAILFIVARTYLDVAIVIGLMMPIGTIFILLLLARKKEAENDSPA